MKATSAAFMALVTVWFFLIGCSQHSKKEVALNRQTPHTLNMPPKPNSSPPVEESESKDGSHEQKVEPTTYDKVQQPMSSTAAVVNPKDSTHWFVRTADVKFETGNVALSTYQVEDNINRLGGYVSYTSLTSTVKNSHVVAVSSDSSLRTTNYDVQNTMIIRVPNTQLDSALKLLAPLVTYLDYRLVKTNDVALALLANRLKQARIARHDERINRATDEHGKKLTDISDVQQALLNKEEEADNAQIDNLNLTDQVKFSTINLSLYQPETVQRQLVYNDKNIIPFEPGLTLQLKEAAQFGWNLFEAIIVFLVKLWPLAFIAVLSAIGFRRFRRVAL